VSHDTDKLIRQLSLVAYLMAERRPLTARDVKSNVEGYSEMSDEAFARRFYSDRSELISLGVPLQSQRDEFTGEELYTLRSEQYFLPPLELSDGELAALQTSFYLLEDRFAYAPPLRLALQNLALGRPGALEGPHGSAGWVKPHDPDYSEDMAGRLTKLEGAISKQRTVKFLYRAMERDEEIERTLNPYALYSDNGAWYVVGKDIDRDAERTFRVSRIRGDIRFATRRERDFRTPTDFDVSIYRGRPPWQVGELAGEARSELSDDTAWWVERAYAGRGRVEEGVFVTPYSNIGQLGGWVLRQDGRARPLDPPELIEAVLTCLERIATRHDGKPRRTAKEAVAAADGQALERTAGPVAPERFAVLQALLARLLAECGEDESADIAAAELIEDFPIPPDQLEEHLQLLNLVNFGGGCYAVYSTLHNDVVHVQKELFGDTFRRSPRLTPLEARAIRLALEFVGPMIAAEANSPLERVRGKLEETFGQFAHRDPTEAAGANEEEDLIRTLSVAIANQRLVEIEYLAVGETTSVRVVEPHLLERDLPHWYLHTWDRTREAKRSFRLDRMKRARALDETFEPRADLSPTKLEQASTARVWFSPKVARWRLERGARELVDGSAVEELRVGSPDWLVGEILSFRGEAMILEPEDLRKLVAQRAAQLSRTLAPRRRRPRTRT
jgi:predicted DNA-binding transcriptional regulator YafY